MILLPTISIFFLNEYKTRVTVIKFPKQYLPLMNLDHILTIVQRSARLSQHLFHFHPCSTFFLRDPDVPLPAQEFSQRTPLFPFTRPLNFRLTLFTRRQSFLFYQNTAFFFTLKLSQISRNPRSVASFSVFPFSLWFCLIACTTKVFLSFIYCCSFVCMHLASFPSSFILCTFVLFGYLSLPFTFFYCFLFLCIPTISCEYMLCFCFCYMSFMPVIAALNFVLIAHNLLKRILEV